MKTVRTINAQLFFLLVLLLLFSNFVWAETTECTAITSLPYVITTQGIYCLTSDLGTSMTSGSAITINTNNVVIDLNGYKIGGLGAGPGTWTTGIYAYQRQNITIRNGTVRGFYAGISLYDPITPYTTSRGHLIEDIRADMNTRYGIFVYGQGNIIRNNQVIGTGGSTHTSGVGMFGILVTGPGARVLNNDVIETKEQTAAYASGIRLEMASGTVVENNRIGNSSLGTYSLGISIASSTDVLVSNNRVATMNYGVSYNPDSTGKYRDNLTSGVTTPYSGGTNAGGNN